MWYNRRRVRNKALLSWGNASHNGTVDILQNWGSLISPQATFLSCESTSYIIQIIFIFYRFQRSWAAATSANIQTWNSKANVFFYNSEKFANNRKDKIGLLTPTHAVLIARTVHIFSIPQPNSTTSKGIVARSTAIKWTRQIAITRVLREACLSYIYLHFILSDNASGWAQI